MKELSVLLYRSNVIDIINKTITSEVGGIIDEEDEISIFRRS